MLHGSRVWKTDRKLEKLPEPVEGNDVDVRYIRYMLDQKKTQMKMMLRYCARCSNCGKSCFLYVNNRDASYIPSHKVFASLGKLYRKKGKVQRQDLENMVDTIWNKCVLCERCYCFIGLNIPEMISLARSFCRSHENHMDSYDCLDCHHDYQNGENVLDEDDLEDGKSANCVSCHSKKASIDLKTAYHRECMGCHRRVNKQEANTIPITCQDCHNRHSLVP